MELRRYLDPRATWRDTSEVDKVRLYTRQSFLWIIVTFSFAGLLEAVARDAWISAPAMIVSAGPECWSFSARRGSAALLTARSGGRLQ
ncbi:hypothetical protein [Rhodococcus sp. P1Y]|uniref:hypothetical protein n=1 Tax=Rhodococcus sp. P1Y TaxID=1302308 RepID=UPI001F1C194D|nr:hypothetical protein [Rhodococcus sp. P1Y]